MKRTAHDLINLLAAQEDSFRGQRFIAPAVPGGQINLRIGKIVCKLKTAPDDFQGVGVFETISFTEAILVREATMLERRQYLELLPATRLIVTHRVRQNWLGSAFSLGDRRFQLPGLVPIQIAENVNLFDSVECRFDGVVFWFDRHYGRANPRHADALRKALVNEVEPGNVKVSGLSAEHRAAYAFNYETLMESRRPKLEQRAASRQPEHDSQSTVNRIRDSLSHAGANLLGVNEQHGNFQVTFQVGGRQFTSAIAQDNLAVVSAGVCLDGFDHEFDLTSLVGVLREGISTRQV